jgi:hypothetical protein
MQYRKSFDAQVPEGDVARIRGFIKNEITYYNVLLGAFSSRVRTMPDLFDELTPQGDRCGERCAAAERA